MDLQRFVESRISDNVWTFVPPCLLVFGTIGNVLSIIVLSRSPSSGSTSVYLSALAVSDLIVLYSGLARQWVRKILDTDVRTLSEIGCKINVFIETAAVQYSSLILVVITAERVFCVWKPHVVRRECNRRVSMTIVALLAGFLMLTNAHFLYGYGLNNIRMQSRPVNGTDAFINVYNESGTGTYDVYTDCKPGQTDAIYREFVYSYWPCVEFSLVFAVPFIALLFGNIVILVNIRRSRKLQRECAYSSARAGPMTMVSVTPMLLALDSVFFVCLGPISVYNLAHVYWWSNQIPDEKDLAVGMLIWSVVNILMYTNNAINVLLYIMCGHKFRAGVKELLFKCCGFHRNSRVLPPSAKSSRMFSCNCTRGVDKTSTCFISFGLSHTDADIEL